VILQQLEQTNVQYRYFPGLGNCGDGIHGRKGINCYFPLSGWKQRISESCKWWHELCKADLIQWHCKKADQFKILIISFLFLQLDHYPPTSYSLPTASDIQFNSPKALFLGKVIGKISFYTWLFYEVFSENAENWKHMGQRRVSCLQQDTCCTCRSWLESGDIGGIPKGKVMFTLSRRLMRTQRSDCLPDAWQKKQIRVKGHLEHRLCDISLPSQCQVEGIGKNIETTASMRRYWGYLK